MTFLGHVADVMLLLGGGLMVTFAAYVWKKENLHEELSNGYENYNQSVVKKLISFGITYVSPVLLLMLFVLVVLSNFFGISII